MESPAPSSGPSSPLVERFLPREVLHTAMWTLLGMMAVGLVAVPILRPPVVWTSVFFAWSHGMVGYMAWRIVANARRRSERARLEVGTLTRVPTVPYRYDPASARETPRSESRPVRGPGASHFVRDAPVEALVEA